jgi:hypothetical protein
MPVDLPRADFTEHINDNLIWNNKPDRVKRNTLIGDITQGGLNMIHIHSFNIYLKLSMIKILLTIFFYKSIGCIMCIKMNI